LARLNFNDQEQTLTMAQAQGHQTVQAAIGPSDQDGTDNVILSYAPEPATLTLLTLAGIPMLLRRRRKG